LLSEGKVIAFQEGEVLGFSTDFLFPTSFVSFAGGYSDKIYLRDGAFLGEKQQVPEKSIIAADIFRRYF